MLKNLKQRMKLKFKQPRVIGWEPEKETDKLVFVGIVGSKAQNLDTPESDTDGVLIYRQSLDDKLGFSTRKSKHFTSNLLHVITESKLVSIDEWHQYPLDHWMHLAAQNNPNILEMLFLPPWARLYESYDWWQIRQSRPLFLSKRLAKTFNGYAMHELHKLLKERVNDDKDNGVSRKNNRIRQFGFDTKHAMHLVRLYKQGIEALYMHRFTVEQRSAERKMLLAILNGKYSLSEIRNKATVLRSRLDEAVQTTTLPEEPYIEQIERLMIRLYKH